MRFKKVISIILLTISATIGLVRGYRMIRLPNGHTLPYGYSQDLIKDTLFSNYALLGWILFFLVGILSVACIVLAVKKISLFAYLQMLEGIFILFFTSMHLLYNGFMWIHIPFMIIPIVLIALGVIQTPRDF